MYRFILRFLLDKVLFRFFLSFFSRSPHAPLVCISVKICFARFDSFLFDTKMCWPFFMVANWLGPAVYMWWLPSILSDFLFYLLFVFSLTRSPHSVYLILNSVWFVNYRWLVYNDGFFKDTNRSMHYITVCCYSVVHCVRRLYLVIQPTNIKHTHTHGTCVSVFVRVCKCTLFVAFFRFVIF